MALLRLASRSPRRADLLRAAGIDFALGPFPDVDESLPRGCCPTDAVEVLARRKAQAVFGRCPGDIVLAADTLVFLDEDVLGKPADAHDAVRMLRLLSGRSHGVCTGVALSGSNADGDWFDVRHATTEVTFRRLSEDEIEAYVATGEPLDKAGAYAIQGGAAAFVTRIVGDFDNVVGLPMGLVRARLRLHGIDV